MGIEEHSVCKHCMMEDSLEHFFCECILVKALWLKVKYDIYNVTNKYTNMTKMDMLLGYLGENNNLINKYIIVAKQAINVFK